MPWNRSILVSLQLNLLWASYKYIPSLSSDFLFNSTDCFIIAIGFSLKSFVFSMSNQLGLIVAYSVLSLENYVIRERVDFFIIFNDHFWCIRLSRSAITRFLPRSSLPPLQSCKSASLGDIFVVLTLLKAGFSGRQTTAMPVMRTLWSRRSVLIGRSSQCIQQLCDFSHCLYLGTLIGICRQVEAIYIGLSISD